VARERGPPKDYPDDFSLEEARLAGFDALEQRGATFHIHNQPKRDPLTIGLAIFAAIAPLVVWVFAGGRLMQRVDQLEFALQDLRRDMIANTERDNRQDVTQGIIGQQYGEIGRRLDSIEKKLDVR
jgi:hypothetical protein